MAKIVYAVAGEGFGHSSRSHLIGKRLIDAGHDVIFAGSNKSLEYLRLYFGNRVKEVFGLTFAYEHGKISPFSTVTKNLSRIIYADRLNHRLFKDHIEPFAPDLVITDFEPFCAWWAIRNKVPFISIDHEHFLTHCKLDRIEGQFLTHLNAAVVARTYYFWAKAYIVINFFDVPVKSANTYLLPPVVRPMLTQYQSSNGGHILIYSTTGQDEGKLLDTLGKFKDQRFIVYGFGEAREIGNCTLKERSTEGFLADLAACRGVIASAGFSLISECLYFKKKMLLLPVAGQYEQIVNTHYAQKLGLGVGAAEVDEESLSAFFAELEKPMPEDKRILWSSNEKFFESLKPIFEKLPVPIHL
ncbi:MAG: glycosyltransferase family protein [Phycisphaerae bacterium]|nr:glycosyltransferase family protein [Phycisphaerae bacterium]